MGGAELVQSKFGYLGKLFVLKMNCYNGAIFGNQIL